MLAPGIAAPVASKTVPEMAPCVVDCAWEGDRSGAEEQRREGQAEVSLSFASGSPECAVRCRVQSVSFGWSPCCEYRQGLMARLKLDESHAKGSPPRLF